MKMSVQDVTVLEQDLCCCSYSDDDDDNDNGDNDDNGNNANDNDDDHVDNQTGPAAAAPPTGGLSRTGAILLSGDYNHRYHRQSSS